MFSHLGILFTKKNKAYGDSYIKFGKICDALFPDGLNLKSKKDFVLFGLFVPIIGKCIRIANLLFNEKSHIKDDVIESVNDSCDDIAIYSQILRKEIENEESR